jgi:hypothetical protein
MIRSTLVVCAESVVRDAETNSISVFNILEDISSAAFPVALPKLSVLFILERDLSDPEQATCLITLRMGNHPIGQATIEGDFEGKLRTRAILVAQGVVISEPGILTIDVVVNETVVGSWDIRARESETATES